VGQTAKSTCDILYATVFFTVRDFDEVVLITSMPSCGSPSFALNFLSIFRIEDMMFKSPRVAVIGAGLSGIVSAKHLIYSGIEVVVYERSSKAGGNWYITPNTLS
jgi:NADPH-dependent 2,4-dienoyl-CoA reductase/sulfur reductase-like enzyme